jgi:hypothetical protein
MRPVDLLPNRGARHPSAKLTPALVVRARELAADGVSVPRILKQLDLSVSRFTLYKAIVGITWKELD